METADLLTKFQQLADIDPATITDQELFNHTIEFEELMAAMAAKGISLQAAVMNRKAYKARKYRSAATGMANQTRLSARWCGRRFNQATVLVNDLPRILAAVEMDVINPDQVNLISQYARQKLYREFAIRDQGSFIDWASHPWPIFRALMEHWAEIVDTRDPQDEDEKAMLDRRLIWGQGLGHTVLAELNLPNEIWEELMVITTPVYDAFLKDELEDAQEIYGDDMEFCDLARTDKQRWADAFMVVIRRGGVAGRKLAADITSATSGEDVSDEGFDPGVQAEVVILCDQVTLEREIARRGGETLDPRPASDAESYVCETVSGRSVSPATALKYLEINSFRRMIRKPKSLDFELSRLTRFFRGPKRLGLIARDRTCQGPGCGTSARYCQGDHIEAYEDGAKRCRPMG